MPEEITNLNSLGFAFTLLMSILIIILPRRHAIIPVIMSALYITLGQSIIIAGLHIWVLRLIIMIGLARVVIRGEVKSVELHILDYLVIAWVLSNCAAYIILRGSSIAVINRLGFAFNILGSYLLFRFLMHDHEDVIRVIKITVVLILPLALLMAIEYLNGRNSFSIFGGVPEITMIRDGKMRCQGPFSHPILAGTFGATTMPLVMSLWTNKSSKYMALSGVFATMIIVFTASSSGPYLATTIAIIGLAIWNCRKYLRWMVWSGFAVIISLAFVMKAPVWALIGKASELIGGGGWHRVELITQAINHMNEWYLIGTDYTRHWMVTGVTYSRDMIDITSMYVRQGVDGGILTLCLFFILIICCFRSVGKIIRLPAIEKQYAFVLWCIGCALLAHVASFLSVNYFDQIIIFWCLMLSFISTENKLYIRMNTPFRERLSQ